MNEEDFRRSIENRLREARPGAAIERLRALLAPYARPQGLLPERFLTVDSPDLVLMGWDTLGNAISRHDQPGRAITALAIAFAWPGDDVTDPGVEGNLRPHLEISYYSDNAFPFSQSGRDDLLEGYSYYGCSWNGDVEATDTALWLEGIDDLHGALALLEARLLLSDEPDEEGIRAGSLGACLLSALLVQAVGDRIARDGLPRPLCVMAGSSGVYPYFDAPVAGMPEDARMAAEAREDLVEVPYGAPAPRYSSLRMTGIPRAKKRAVLVLDESDDELSSRLARLRGINHTDSVDEETRLEAIAAADVTEQSDPPAAEAGNGPLLAKKPARQAKDLYEMLGLPAPDPPGNESSPPLLTESPEPAEPGSRSEAPVGPGFALLDADQQQRLKNLLSPSPLPRAVSPWPMPPIPADQPAPYWPGGPDWREDSRAANGQEVLPADPIAPPVRSSAGARLGDWLRDGVKAWLASFRA